MTGLEAKDKLCLQNSFHLLRRENFWWQGTSSGRRRKKPSNTQNYINCLSYKIKVESGNEKPQMLN